MGVERSENTSYDNVRVNENFGMKNRTLNFRARNKSFEKFWGKTL